MGSSDVLNERQSLCASIRMCSYWLLGTGDDAAYANSRYSMVFHYLIIRQKPVRSMNNEWASKRALTAATGTDVVIQSL